MPSFYPIFTFWVVLKGRTKKCHVCYYKFVTKIQKSKDEMSLQFCLFKFFHLKYNVCALIKCLHALDKGKHLACIEIFWNTIWFVTCENTVFSTFRESITYPKDFQSSYQPKFFMFPIYWLNLYRNLLKNRLSWEVVLVYSLVTPNVALFWEWLSISFDRIQNRAQI